MSGAALASELVKHGIPWNRTTVAKLETGRRESVTAQELLALAYVFGVPPMWLLVDTQEWKPTPIAVNRPGGEPDVDADPWSALLWMSGRGPLEGAPDEGWTKISGALEAVFAYKGAVDQLRRNAKAWAFIATMPEVEGVHLDSPEEAARKDRMMLLSMTANLRTLQKAGLSLPPIPADIRARAEELGYDLPGQEA
jgi:hypothetical protein